jgi:hypothetical protein
VEIVVKEYEEEGCCKDTADGGDGVADGVLFGVLKTWQCGMSVLVCRTTSC